MSTQPQHRYPPHAQLFIYQPHERFSDFSDEQNAFTEGKRVVLTIGNPAAEWNEPFTPSNAMTSPVAQVSRKRGSRLPHREASSWLLRPAF